MADSEECLFFRNCEKPTLSPVSGVVKGNVPAWLNGTLTRNGPGIQNVGGDTYKHMFDGLAIIHRFHIDNGVVTYNSRPLESDTYHKNMAANRIVVSEFGTAGVGDPCDTLFSKFKSVFVANDKTKEDSGTSTDNCVVNVAYYGDQLYAMTETAYLRQIDPVTLETIGKKTNISDYVAVNMASAHPHILPDGTVLNMGVNYRHKDGISYVFIQVPPTFGSTESLFKDANIVASIPSRWKLYPGYYHSFGMTTDKIIFIEQPYCINVPRAILKSMTKISAVDVHSWYPNEKSRFHIVSSKNGERLPVVYETDKLFVFHHANTYEENGCIIVDVAGYDSGKFVIKHLNRDTIKSKEKKYVGASVRRYILPLDVTEAKLGDNILTHSNSSARAVLRKKGKSECIVDITPEILHDAWFEFPRINYKYNGVRYRYIYGVKSTESNETMAFPEPNLVVKLDTETHETLSWAGDRVYASEPVFVPNPNIGNATEDDGVILTNLLHADDQSKTTLLILDAKTMKEVASVEFKTEGAVTSTFHGQWATTGDRVHVY